MRPGIAGFEMLRTRAPGWERLRDELWQALVARIEEIVLDGAAGDDRDRRVRPRFRGLLLDAEDAREFVSDLALSRIERIDAGTLLDGIDFEDGDDLCRRLASRDFVRKRAVGHARDRPRRLAHERRASRSEAVEPREASVAPRDIGAELSSLLRLPVPTPGGIQAVHRHAAMQTYPQQCREDDFALYLDDLKATLRPSGERGPLEHLDDRHVEASTVLAEEQRRLEEDLIEHPHRSESSRRRIQSRLAKTLVASLVCPLKADAVQALLGLATGAAARQQISRYRRELSRVFPGTARLQRVLDGEETP